MRRIRAFDLLPSKQQRRRKEVSNSPVCGSKEELLLGRTSNKRCRSCPRRRRTSHASERLLLRISTHFNCWSERPSTRDCFQGRSTMLSGRSFPFLPGSTPMFFCAAQTFFRQNISCARRTRRSARRVPLYSLGLH